MTTHTAIATAADATTRADLLRARADRLPALERQAWSIPAAVEVSGWSVLLVPASLAPAAGDGSTAFAVAVPAVVGTLATWRLLGRLRAWRGARAEIEGWRRADRSARARSLPAGDLDAALRTPYDARDDADLDAVVAEAGAAAAGRIYDMRLLWFGLALVPGLVMGILLLLMALPVSDQQPASRAAAAGAAFLVWLVVGWLLAGLQREGWRRQRALGATGLEKDLWRARQALLRGEPVPGPGPVAPLAARLVVILLFLGILGFLAARLTQVAGTALLMVAGALTVLALPVVAGLVRRRALHVVPLLHGGDDVLSTPWHPVAVTRDATGLTVRSDRVEDLVVPAEDILGVVPVPPGYAFAPPTVAVLRRAGEPVVLAGRGAGDLLES